MNRKTRFRSRSDSTFWPTHVVRIFQFCAICYTMAKQVGFSMSPIVQTSHIFSCYIIHLVTNVFSILFLFTPNFCEVQMYVQLFPLSSVFPVFHAVIHHFFSSSDPIKFGAVNLLQTHFCCWSNKRNRGKVWREAKKWSSNRRKGRIH
jgi:hypothetical protein